MHTLQLVHVIDKWASTNIESNPVYRVQTGLVIAQHRQQKIVWHGTACNVLYRQYSYRHLLCGAGHISYHTTLHTPMRPRERERESKSSPTRLDVRTVRMWHSRVASTVSLLSQMFNWTHMHLHTHTYINNQMEKRRKTNWCVYTLAGRAPLLSTQSTSARYNKSTSTAKQWRKFFVALWQQVDTIHHLVVYTCGRQSARPHRHIYSQHKRTIWRKMIS